MCSFLTEERQTLKADSAATCRLVRDFLDFLQFFPCCVCVCVCVRARHLVCNFDFLQFFRALWKEAEEVADKMARTHTYTHTHTQSTEKLKEVEEVVDKMARCSTVSF
jgi:hypothetical protein